MRVITIDAYREFRSPSDFRGRNFRTLLDAGHRLRTKKKVPLPSKITHNRMHYSVFYTCFIIKSVRVFVYKTTPVHAITSDIQSAIAPARMRVQNVTIVALCVTIVLN